MRCREQAGGTLGLHLALDCVPNLESWQADAGAAGCRAADRGQRIQEEKEMKCVICKHYKTAKRRKTHKKSNWHVIKSRGIGQRNLISDSLRDYPTWLNKERKD